MVHEFYYSHEWAGPTQKCLHTDTAGYSHKSDTHSHVEETNQWKVHLTDHGTAAKDNACRLLQPYQLAHCSFVPFLPFPTLVLYFYHLEMKNNSAHFHLTHTHAEAHARTQGPRWSGPAKVKGEVTREGLNEQERRGKNKHTNRVWPKKSDMFQTHLDTHTRVHPHRHRLGNKEEDNK